MVVACNTLNWEEVICDVFAFDSFLLRGLRFPIARLDQNLTLGELTKGGLLGAWLWFGGALGFGFG